MTRTLSAGLKAILPALLLAAGPTVPLTAQTPSTGAPLLLKTSGAVIPSNSVSHLTAHRGILWAGTNNGLARSSDGGRTWQSFGSVPAFANPGIYAVDVKGDTIWAATGYSKEVDNSSVPTGSGSAFSTNDGQSWSSIPQPLDGRGDSIVTYGRNRVDFLPITVPEQNVTYDVSLSDSAVWIASWSSGIRKSTDLGKTWQRIVLPAKSMSSIAPTDTLGTYLIDPRTDNNYLGFAVAAVGNDTIWAGTAGGVNFSTDRGTSWKHFTADQQPTHIASDWVIAIAAQRLSSGTRIWTTNWPAEGTNQELAVSYTDDNGASWHTFLNGVKAYGFAFRDSIAYVATDDGVYRTSDGGATWLKSGTVIDPANGSRLTTFTFYAVASIGDTLFAASGDGLARTVDNAQHPFGSAWEVIRSYAPSGSRSTVYAYPNPFSPAQEAVRIHYTTGSQPGTVTIELFDFGMNRIRTVVKDVARTGESDEIWDGRDDTGRVVPNGVVFYRVTISGSDPAWGKILVLQ